MASTSMNAEPNAASGASASPGEPSNLWVRYNGGRATKVSLECVSDVDNLIDAAYNKFQLEDDGVRRRNVFLHPHGWDETRKSPTGKALRPGLPVGQVEGGDTDGKPLELVGPDVPATGGAAQAGGAGAFAFSSHPVRVT